MFGRRFILFQLVFSFALISSCTNSTVPSPLKLSSKHCSDGWVYFEKTNSCYGFYNHAGNSWQNVENYCSSNFKAHSASIHSDEERAFLYNYVISICHDSCQAPWIGLHTLDRGKTWLWSDNSTTDFFHWGLSEPNINWGHCVRLYPDIFSTYPCEGTAASLCKKTSGANLISFSAKHTLGIWLILFFRF